jgi:hypothetical protein
MATKKMILAISIESPAIPPKPSTAAISAMTRKVKAHPNMLRLRAKTSIAAKTPRQPVRFHSEEDCNGTSTSGFLLR